MLCQRTRTVRATCCVNVSRASSEQQYPAQCFKSKMNLERARIDGKVLTAMSLSVLKHKLLLRFACGFGRPGDRVSRLFFSFFARLSTHKCVPRTKYDGTHPLRETRHRALGSTVVTDHCVTVVETGHARPATQQGTCCDPSCGP